MRQVFACFDKGWSIRSRVSVQRSPCGHAGPQLCFARGKLSLLPTCAKRSSGPDVESACMKPPNRYCKREFKSDLSQIRCCWPNRQSEAVILPKLPGRVVLQSHRDASIYYAKRAIVHLIALGVFSHRSSGRVPGRPRVQAGAGWRHSRTAPRHRPRLLRCHSLSNAPRLQ